MISRKERRIQEALGLGGDIPLTIRKRIKNWWWWHISINTYKYTMDEFWRWLAFKLPKRLVYHSTIRTWAHATTCSSGCKENACDTTMDNAIRRWEKE